MFCLSPFCYVCLRNKEELFNLNNVDGDLMRLWDKLLYCMPEIEDINEDIPLFICRECRRDLRVAYTFRKRFVTNFPYVDDYIRQLTYVDELLVAEDETEVTEHADLCVTLVDFAKRRCQQSSSNIKIETSDEESNSAVDDSQAEIQPIHKDDVFSNCSDTENVPLSYLYKEENQPADTSDQSEENSSESFQQETPCSIESPTKRRKLDDTSIVTEIIDIEDDGSDDIMSLVNTVPNLVQDDNSSLEEISVLNNKHDHNYNDLDDISSNTEVQEVSDYVQEEQAVINEMSAEVSTLKESQNVDIDNCNGEQESIVLEQSNLHEESTGDSGQSPGTEQPSIDDTTTTSAAVNTLQSTGESSAADLQATCDQPGQSPSSSNKNKEENVINQLKTNIESSSAAAPMDASTNLNKENTRKQQLDSPVHGGSGTLNQEANTVTQTVAAQPADDGKAIRPDDAVTNALFKSIRTSNGGDNEVASSRPSLATSMYESDIIDDGLDFGLSENSDEYISDNDEPYDRPDTCCIDREYSDISSPDNTADDTGMNTSVSPEATSEIRQSGCGKSASTTLAHIKRPVSDVEDNYSNETVLFQAGVQPNTATSPAGTSFSFMKAYLTCTEASVSTTDMNTGSKHCQSSNSDQIQSSDCTNAASTNSTDACSSQKTNQSVLPTTAVTTSTTQGTKCASAECKKSVYTSIRRKIPRLIDLNGSIRKNVTSTFTHTTWNNKYTLIKHTQQAHHHQSVNCETSNGASVQHEMCRESSDATADSNLNNILTNTSETFSTTSAVYKCTMCDATFKYQSLLDCHVEEKHTRRQELLPDIIVQDERQVVRNNNRLATYRIPHVNKNKSGDNSADRLDNNTTTLDTSHRRISVSERVEQTAVNKHRVGTNNSVDVATDTANLLSTKDKPSTNKNTEVLLHKQHLVASARQQTLSQVDNTNGDQLKPSEKRDKSQVTKHNHTLPSNNSVLDSMKVHRKKKHKNIHTMIDKAIGTIDFSDNSTGIYAFTDAIEENMCRIQNAGEKSAQCNNQKQSNRQQGEKVCSKVKAPEKIHKQPGIVHYYQTTKHLPSDKHGTKACKKRKVTATIKTVQKVDKSTETVDLLLPSIHPQILPVIKNKTVSSVGGSSEQPQATVTNNNNNISNDGDKESTKCSLCASTFADMNSLREHLIIEHKTYKKFQCTLCEKYFRQRCRLLYHMVNSHAKAQLNVCPICHKSFSSTSTLKRHMLCHYGDKPHKCTVCDKAFRYKESVKTHMVLHTGVKAYRCPYCDRAFAFKGNMLQHVQTHTKDKRYPCPLCDKDFCTNTVMKQHMRTHTGERPYKCPTCQRAFTVRQTMVQHMSVHTDVKPHPCTMCTARFKQKSHLRRHMYVHTDDKPYECTVCDKTFRLKTELDQHATIHDNTRQPFTCDICNIGYSRRDNLYAHNFNIHYKKDINHVSLS